MWRRGEVKKEQATPNEQEKINNHRENNGANHKEQKTNQNNSKNNSHQGKGQDSADKQLRAEEKEK